MRSRPCFAALFASVCLASCWFPGNPTGMSGSKNGTVIPTPACPASFAEGNACAFGEMRLCDAEGVTYECTDSAWHKRR